MVLAAGLSLSIPVPSTAADGAPLPAQAIALPTPEEDADGDSYRDDVDLTFGDLQVGLRLTALQVPGRTAAPYVLVGTQDDHWRVGAGAELEWRHVVDPDSLGRKAGSPGWQENVLRTGMWWMTRPGEGLDLAITNSAALTVDGAPGAVWPQTVWANVRDDRPLVNLTLELRDAAATPDAVRGTWVVQVDVLARQIRQHERAWQPLGTSLRLQTGDAFLDVEPRLDTGLTPADRQTIARRWAPTLHFDSGEAFYPVPGDLLEQFHGFTRRLAGADLRTWDFNFNNGRDGYRLFLADFDGDRDTDHVDARIMYDLLAQGAIGQPTVYYHVGLTTGQAVVVQYWLLYFYNFVLDDGGNDIAALKHNGDREFVQVTFDNLDQARNGTPSSISFSQHYEGLRVTNLDPDEFPLREGNLSVYVARGSHANYPSPGDDRRLRSSLTSYYDRFDGEGRVLTPDNYTLEALGGQPWHAGYLWGPVTRYTRDLGTSTRPLLQHDFRYMFTDPLWWQENLRTVAPEELPGMYGVAP